MKITKENLKKDLNNFCKNFKPTMMGEVWLKEDMMILNDVIKNKKLSKLDLEIIFIRRYKEMGKDFKEKMIKLVNWDDISCNRNMGNDFMDEFKDFINWEKFEKYNMLSL